MNPFRYIKRIKGKIPVVIICAIVITSCSNKEQNLFSEMDSGSTGITFVNEVHDSDTLGILDYLYFYNGGGVAIGDINNDGLQDIFFTANHHGSNKLYLNKGNLKFEDITSKAGVAGISDWASGVTMADVNGDGLLDIYVCTVSGKLGLDGHNELFINNGNNSFSERSAEYRLNFSGYSTQAAFFDYDRDGDLDCYLLNQSDHSVEVYRDTSNRRKVSEKSGDKLYRNDGLIFTDVTLNAGIYSSGLGYGLGLGIADLNSDGWDDIYVGNDFHENDYYYVNNGNGTFTENGETAFAHYSRFSMGNDIADYNNDGYPDVVTVDMLPEDEKNLKRYGGEESLDIYQYKITHNGFQNQYSRNCLQQNIANGSKFSDVALQTGVAATDWSWAPLFADFDNDGIKDLFISNGIQKRMLDLDYIKFISSFNVQRKLKESKVYDAEVLQKIPGGECHDYVFRGTADGIFQDQSKSWGFERPTLSNGGAYADLDNDGDLDLVVNRMNSEAGIYRNNSTGRNYLQLKLKGNTSNKFGVGARIYVFTGSRLQMQELRLTRGFQSSVPPLLHFGLDSFTEIDSLIIVWPGNRSQTLHNIKTNSRLELSQANAKDSFSFALLFKNSNPLLQDVTVETGLNWSHKENRYFDFNRQYLIPHMLSTDGPKIAVGDVNADGLDDIFVCGAKDQPGAMFIQNNSAKFEEKNKDLFAADAKSEDVDAVYFDCDADNDLDLLVVSGGNEYSNGDTLLFDRLYLNDGKGIFSKALNALPGIAENKSCVRAADINNDGLTDLFIGGRANAFSYGEIPRSYILINKGNGKFTDASSQWLGTLQHLGMTSASVFNDFNRDGKIDLIISGEWMPVIFLANDGSKFKDVTAEVAPPKLNGWWCSISLADINHDNIPDLVLGNYGTNSKLQASAEFPLRMYVADLDGNGNNDQLLCINKNGIYYSFLGKEELEKQLPFLKKKFLQYGAAAGKSVDEIFDKKSLEDAKVFEAYNLKSGVLINDGKGKFSWQEFPAAAQVAPVFAVLQIDLKNNKTQLLGGGNFYGVLPYEGRYDASNLWLLEYENNRWKSLMASASSLNLPGEVRDIKSARSINGSRYVLVARNNDFLKVYK